MRSTSAHCALYLLVFGAATAVGAPTDIDAIVTKISTQRIEERVRKLAAFGTRHSLSETDSNTRGIGAARRWIASELQACSRAVDGKLRVTLDEFIADRSARIPKPTPMVNIVATLPGTQIGARERIYVVSGHYDSMPSKVMDSTALAPAAPKDAAVETIKLENDTTLRWSANNEPDMAGYRIVWRETTAPYWQHSRDVGNVTRYTLNGVSKDDYLFGVVALDKQGNDSVASYPNPYRPARN